MTRLTGWSAKPSGGKLTITGKGPDRKLVTITGIATIETVRAWRQMLLGRGITTVRIATHRDGTQYELA